MKTTFQFYQNFNLFKLCYSSTINDFAKKGLFIIIIIICSINAFAQQNVDLNLFVPITGQDLLKASEKYRTKLEKLRNNRAFKNITIVRVENLAKIQKNGILTFSVPNIDKNCTFWVNKVDVDSEITFKWKGLSADGLNTAIFISDNGLVYGSFSIDKRHFQVFSLETNVSILLEEDDTTEVSCSSKYLREEPHPMPPNSIKNGRKSACNEALRVLVVYTQNGADAVANIGQTINLSIEQFNTSIDNSGIGSQQTNKIELCGTQLVSFTTNNPESTSDAFEAAQNIRDNATIQNFRNQYLADLVICLVDANYSNGTVGSVISIPASNSNYCAVVESSYSSSAGFFTFTHELGHLLGGRHQSDSDGPSYSHGYSFTTNPPIPFTSASVRTIMHTFDLNSTRITNFSNPNITFSGSTTGTIGTNNVARRIGETSPTIVEFRSSGSPSFNGYIQGVGNIGTSGSYEWELMYSCKDVASYVWRYSTDGFNFGSPIGYSNTLYYNLNNSNNGLFYIKCTVTTTDNQTYNITKYVSVNICSGCRLLSNNEELIGDDIHIYPNPSQTKIAINYSLEGQTEVEIGIFDLTGRSVLSKYVGVLSAGNHQSEVVVGNFDTGKYIFKILRGNKVSSKAFIVSK